MHKREDLTPVNPNGYAYILQQRQQEMREKQQPQPTDSTIIQQQKAMMNALDDIRSRHESRTK